MAYRGPSRTTRKRADFPFLTPRAHSVAKVHKEGQRYVDHGRTVILIGHAGHPEVEGTLGQLRGRVYLVQDQADVSALDIPPDTPLAYITQTTLSVDDTRSTIVAIKKRFTNVVGPDTRDICYATQNRQSSGARIEQAGRTHSCCWREQ